MKNKTTVFVVFNFALYLLHYVLIMKCLNLLVSAISNCSESNIGYSSLKLFFVITFSGISLVILGLISLINQYITKYDMFPFFRYLNYCFGGYILALLILINIDFQIYPHISGIPATARAGFIYYLGWFPFDYYVIFLAYGLILILYFVTKSLSHRKKWKR